MPIPNPDAPYLAIFDHDGVLVDSLELHQNAWVEMGRRTGLSLTPEFIHETFGMTNPSIFRKLLGNDVSESDMARYGDIKETSYRDAARGVVRLMEGVRELLDDLTARGFLLAIGSSGVLPNLELTVQECGLTGRFAAIASLEDITRGKPDPQVFLVAAKKAGAPPSRSVVFEDAPVGIQAAKAAGMLAVGVGTTHPLEALTAAGADMVAATLKGFDVDALRERLEGAAMNRVAVLGSGGMGTALALLFSRAGGSVRLWGRDPSHVAELVASKENTRHLPGVPLPDAVRPSADARDVVRGADLIVAAIPSAFLRETLGGFAGLIPEGVTVLSVVKGIENKTFARPSQIVVEVLGPRSVSILSGPSHAEEIARGLPASVVVAGADDSLNSRVQDALNQGMFRVYTSGDAVGVELAGALKNILGIAAGICDGLGFGDNAKAALLTRGLVEISRFVVDLGGRPETISGLAGVGDVVTTCYSPFGRNRTVGRKIGQGATLVEVLAGMEDVAEGVATTRSVHDQSLLRKIEMPITSEVHQILFAGKAPLAAVIDLMLRIPRTEAP